MASYIAKKGKAAAESATAEKQDFSKALVPFKSGTTYKVRLASDKDFVEYHAASVFKVFYTSPVAPGSLYQQATDALYADAKKAADAGDEAKSEELRDQAYQLKPKPRYLFGFIDLASGEPMIVDTSKAQAKVLIAAIDKYAKKLGKVAFELAKEGKGTSTTVSLSPVLDMDDDLSDAERKNFDEAADKTIADDLFENVLYVKDADEQAQDLTAFGFDTSRLNISEAKPAEGNTNNDPTKVF
jgi:hypothetical protein